MKKIILGLLLVLPLAACATPQTRLERGLMSAGLSPRTSSCMADRMWDKLSLLQLKRLSSIGNFRDERLREMSLDRFLYNIRSLEDPEILTVTSKAALSCAILR